MKARWFKERMAIFSHLIAPLLLPHTRRRAFNSLALGGSEEKVLLGTLPYKLYRTCTYTVQGQVRTVLARNSTLAWTGFFSLAWLLCWLFLGWAVPLPSWPLSFSFQPQPTLGSKTIWCLLETPKHIYLLQTWKSLVRTYGTSTKQLGEMVKKYF